MHDDSSEEIGRRLQHPALVGGNNFYTIGDENLSVVTIGAVAGVVLTVRLRFLNMNGEITPMEFQFTASSDRTTVTVKKRLGIGWILNCVVFVSTGSVQFGQLYVKVHLIRGLEGATITMATLIDNLVASNMPLAWPGSPQSSPRQEPGATRPITGTMPAVGAQISETVPTGAMWALMTLRATYTTSAIVGTRQLLLTLSDGVSLVGTFASTTTEAAGLAANVTWSTAGSFVGIGNVALAGMLPQGLLLLPGWIIGTTVINGDAGDQWSAPHYAVEERLIGS